MLVAPLQVFTNTILQQIFEIEYTVSHGQCPDCTKLAAKNTWSALVQVRQKVSHKRTFLFLEQLILKHNAHKDTINIREAKDGLDFFYTARNHAIKMVEFLNNVTPIKSEPPFPPESFFLIAHTSLATDPRPQSSFCQQTRTLERHLTNSPTPSSSSPSARMISSVSPPNSPALFPTLVNSHCVTVSETRFT